MDQGSARDRRAHHHHNYDNLGRLTQASSGTQTLTFTYDALGRNLTQAGPLGTTAYQYDLAGRRTLLDYPGSGLVVNYDYLVTGEVSAIRENNATVAPGILATFGYDQLGRRTSLTRGNGSVTSYGYDPVSRLASLVQNLPGTAGDLTLGFTYNPASQIATNTRSNDLYAYTGHVNESVADTRNGRNEVIATDGVTVTYDGRRNIATLPAPASGTGVATAYTYNSENMLTAGGATTLAYDPLMRLYQVSTTRWAYDGAEMIAEYNTSNALLRRFVHGPGVDEPPRGAKSAGSARRRGSRRRRAWRLDPCRRSAGRARRRAGPARGAGA